MRVSWSAWAYNPSMDQERNAQISAIAQDEKPPNRDWGWGNKLLESDESESHVILYNIYENCHNQRIRTTDGIAGIYHQE